MKTIKLSIPERIALLEKLDLAADLTESEFEKLAQYILVYSVEENELIFDEGEDACYLALVVSGRVRIVKGSANQSPQKIAIIEAGQILGEMALIDGEPRSASVYAQEDTQLLLLTEKNFHKLRTQFSLLGMKILTAIARAMSRRLRLTNDWLIDALAHSYEGVLEIPAETEAEETQTPSPPATPSPLAASSSPGPSCDDDYGILSTLGSVLAAQPPISAKRLASEVEDLQKRVAALEAKLGA